MWDQRVGGSFKKKNIVNVNSQTEEKVQIFSLLYTELERYGVVIGTES